jgi:hypothetical protein
MKLFEGNGMATVTSAADLLSNPSTWIEPGTSGSIPEGSPKVSSGLGGGCECTSERRRHFPQPQVLGVGCRSAGHGGQCTALLPRRCRTQPAGPLGA